MGTTLLGPANPKDRFEVYRFFNGLSAEAKEGLDQRKGRVPLVKTFLLEHVSCRSNIQPKRPSLIFEEMGCEIGMLDGKFMSLKCVDRDSRSQTTTGFLEQYDERFFAYYTCEDSKNAQDRVKEWILRSPDLDSTWFSSPLLQELWDQNVSKRGDDRFGMIAFQHESKYDMPEGFSASDGASDDSVSEETIEDTGDSEDRPEIERRNAVFKMGDRIGRIRHALSKLQEDYKPLYALSGLRLPSRIGHGGHDLYRNGRITNRTGSFEDHRNTVRYLYRIYKSILESTERSAWPETSKVLKLHTSRGGVPLIVRFDESISKSTFERWVQMAFRKGSTFNLWGNPIKLGPTKVHVYGADRHLWQPINLELTETGLVAILPKDTCGNTFHRLVTNIQHYVYPKIRAWIGSQTFKELVSQWPIDAEVPNEDH